MPRILPNWKVSTDKAQEVGDFMTEVVSQFEHLANFANLWKDEPQQEFPAIEKVLEKYKQMVRSFTMLEDNLEVEYVAKFKGRANVGLIDLILASDGAKMSDAKLIDLVDQYEGQDTLNSTMEVVKQYMYSWQSFPNYRVMDVYTTNHPEDGKMHNIFKASILLEIAALKRCTSLKEYLFPLFDEYFFGYIIGNKVFRNLLYGKLRLFIARENGVDIGLKNFMDIVKDIDSSSSQENGEYVKEAFLCLCSYLQKKIRVYKEIDSESDIYLLYSKIIGLLYVVRIMYRNFDVLESNENLRSLKDYFEEIHCDAGAISISLRDKNRLGVGAPTYVHWILTMAAHNNKEDVLGSVREFEGQRIFLSAGAKKYFIEEYSYLSAPDTASLQVLLAKVKNRFRLFDQRIIAPLYHLFEVTPHFITTDPLGKEEFIQEFLKMEKSYTPELAVSVYSVYLKVFEGHSVSEEDETSIVGHLKGVINTIAFERLKGVIERMSKQPLQESVRTAEEMLATYPYCGYLYQEVAIAYDMNGHSEKAFQAISKSLLLQPEDELKWDSFFVILKKIL